MLPLSHYSGSPYERQILDLMDRELKLRGSSPRTRKAYLGPVARFVRSLGRDPRQADTPDIEQYLLHLVENEQVSRSYHTQAVSALKLLYDRVLKTARPIRDVPRPRREKKLPSVLSRAEVARLLAGADGAAHRLHEPCLTSRMVPPSRGPGLRAVKVYMRLVNWQMHGVSETG